MPQSSASAVRTLSAQSAKSPLERASAALGATPKPVPGPVPVPPPAPVTPPERRNNTHDLDVIGPRKLIRPTLPEGFTRTRRPRRTEETSYLWRPATPQAASHESSSAEAFYFQKQIQTQTPMVFLLDDGERIEGSIEWYDRDVIKVRCNSSSQFHDQVTRLLIYKSAIKYLFKAGENQPQF